MKQRMMRIIIAFSNFGHISASILLYLVALSILISAVWVIVKDIYVGYSIYTILDEVGLIIFSIAVIDVGKYLMLEEVMHVEKKSSQLKKFRKNLTRFSIIIVSALSLEGLVLTIEVAKQDITKILYPIGLLVSAVLYIIGIGIYHKFHSIEK